MGNIEELLSVIRKGPEIASQIDGLKLSGKTIARGAKDSTFQFPCIVASTVPVDLAYTTAKTLDKVYAVFTQTWISMNSMFDITLDPTPLAYLRRIHQNFNFESTTVDEEEMDRYMEKVYDGSYKLFMNEEKNYGVLFNVSEKSMSDIYNENKDLLREYMSEFDLRPIEEADSTETLNVADIVDGMQKARVSEKKLRDSAQGKAPKITDRDLKRSNDMLPYGIEVRLIAVNDKKEFVQYIDVVIGVKTILHRMESNDLVEGIVSTLQNKSFAFKMLRWTTGEISLIKDILLNVDELRSDAINRSNGKVPFLGALKKLKGKRFGVSNFTSPHRLIPNATIVITRYEVDFIQNNFGIDLLDSRTALKLMEALFLMGFIVIDDYSNIMHAIYDGDRQFQEFSMDTLERENNANQNRLNKEIGRMLAR